ncbi:MAG TPA: AAA family ATPase [Gemmatimonadaceae bacterium]|nr:AAA family ATPase [Gemmatimonadaceae bacterium]
MLRIKRLYPKHCRGIVDGPALEFGTGGLILCGDNGTGKSSYIDALEKVLTGRCSSLDTGDLGISWAKQGANLLSKAGPEVELVLFDGGKESTITLDTDRAKLSKQLRAWLAAACKHSFLLRRRSMLRFVESKPADRYKAIEEFLNLQEFQRVESRLRGAKDHFATLVSSETGKARQVEQTLRNGLGLPGTSALDEPSVVAKLSSVLAAASMSELESVSALPQRVRDLDAAIAELGNTEVLQRLYGLLQLCRDLPDGSSAAEARQAYGQAQVLRDEIAAHVVGHFNGDVLQGALAWLREDELSSCPVCEQPVREPEFSERIAARLAENARLLAAEDELRRAREAFVVSVGEWLDRLKALKEKWKEVAGGDFPASAQALGELCKRLKREHRTAQNGEVVGADLSEWDTHDLAAVRSLLIAETEAALRDKPTTERHRALLSARALLGSVEVQWPLWRELLEQARESDGLAKQFSRLVDHAEAARKSTVQSLMERVAAVANEYYQRIHPNEKLGNPRLKITQRGTASIALESEFHGEVGDPRGRYSEGHVDSLGLCLFLAIRRLHHTQEKDFALLVLDDVLHSVDGDHRSATAKLIFDEFRDHQIVVTTHDRMWFENLKVASKGREARQYRFAGWALGTGPQFGDHLSDYEWLQSKAGAAAIPADRVIKAGRLLEETLQNLCDRLSVAVPFRLRGDYSIDPLWSGFRAAAEKNQGFASVAGPTIKEIEELRQLRNWTGAHWNVWAQLLSDSEATAFADAVVRLRRFVYCEDCDRFVERIAQLDGVWSCKGEHLRYDKAHKA